MADYIDREAVCKRLVEAADVQRKAKSREFAAGMMGAQGVVWMFPTAENVVEVVHGYWIEKWAGNGWNEWTDCTCSVCKTEFEKFEATKYCPECGARMDGRREDGEGDD